MPIGAATPAIGKGKTWPTNRGRITPIDQFLQRHRDAQAITITCGVEGCDHVVRGKFVHVRLALKHHRLMEHPGWVAPKRKRQ